MTILTERSDTMGVPTKEARLAHAAKHCELWNAKRKDEWIASWRTIARGNVTMFDPVGTKEKHGFDHATSEAYGMFRPFLEMQMLTVKVNGNEMAWVIESTFTANGQVGKALSIETFAWADNGDLTIKTYYDLPDSVGADDDPYVAILGEEGVIPNGDREAGSAPVDPISSPSPAAQRGKDSVHAVVIGSVSRASLCHEHRSSRVANPAHSGSGCRSTSSTW